ncbi:FGGY-family carbohydrate kinase [Microbacterium aurantiacum]|uniref:Sugar kinase n=1 Tax=Microbacterium aurantiacum TaxID=162393 RepID=A0AAJ2LUL8_9MICO|nr:FGGY-family carbohydrate kinase [Microbacterium aurantiacum]MDS0244270.1 hypothetical protein [Microbacterium aurantiacum]
MAANAQAPLILGIDIGTSGTRVALATANGRPLRDASATHGTAHPAPGQSEHDADTTWWEPITRLVREVVGDAADRVVSVSVSGLGPCVLVVDEDARPLRPAILYGVDTRSTRQIETMRAELAHDAVRRDRLTTQSVGPKLLWIQEHEPEIWERVRRVFTAHNYIAHRLGGGYVLDRVSASWWDPLAEPDGSAWRTKDVRRWMPDLELPAIVEPDALIGRISAAAAEATGLRIGTAIHAGTTDYAAHVIGSGVSRPGECLVVFGTTLSVNLITDAAVIGAGIGSAPGVVAGTWYTGGVTAAAGALLTWVTALTGSSHAELTALADRVGPGSDGVIVLPYFSGERSPVEDPHLRGAVLGLDLAHSAGHVYRAALEAVAFSLRHILDTVGRRPERIVAAGGGSANPILMQTVADVTGIPVVIADDGSAAYGSCVLAGAAVRAPSGEGAVRRPDDRAAAVLAECYRTYLDAAGAMAPISHHITALSAHRAGRA